MKKSQFTIKKMQAKLANMKAHGKDLGLPMLEDAVKDYVKQVNNYDKLFA